MMLLVQLLLRVFGVKTMASIRGVKSLQATLKKMELKAKADNRDVLVGYTASYAIYVHEMTMVNPGKKRTGEKGKGKYWDPQGKAGPKFLEEPMRENINVLADIIKTTYKRTGRMDLALKAAGLRLQRESMLRVPVDTGNLKASAFTRYA